MIDAGICKSRVKKALNSIGKDLEDINIVLLTHEHTDHTKYQEIYEPNIVFGPKSCVKELSNILRPSLTYNIGTYEISVFEASHDVECFAYIIKSVLTGEAMLYITDTGYINSEILDVAKDLEYYVIEANHDPDMELTSNRPPYLIRRNMSDTGHLNNYDSAYYLTLLVGSRTRVIMFAHLSTQCNNEERTLNAYKEVFIAQRGKVIENIDVYCLKQDQETRIKELVR